MLRMDQVHVIRHKVLREGASIRQVARELGLSRNTVSKYLDQSAPARRTYRQRGRPVWARVQPRLEELVAEWEPRTTAKQRLTGVRLHRALLEEGYQVGLTTIHQYLRERRRQRAEVYVPLIHRVGDEAQVDFFEVTVELDGQWHKVWKFLLRLMYSGREFVWLYQRCDTIAFLDGHVRAFSYLGGVPRRCIYDNLPAAVRKIVGVERKLTKRFEALVSHYLFEPCFARVGEGHDKGGVESRGKAIRLQHMTPVPRGESLTAIAQLLITDLERAFAGRNSEGRSLGELWHEERPQLLLLPAAPFEVSEPILVEISSRALVRVEGAWYSTPSRWARLRATAFVGVEEIRLVCMGERVLHPRVGFGRRRIVYRHYLPELARKPQAVRQIAPELLAELGEPWGSLWQLLAATHGQLEAARILAKLLGTLEEHGEERLRPVLEAALAHQRAGLLDDMTSPPAAPQSIVVPHGLANIVIEAGKAADYDHLLLTNGGAHE
jgi:transposase